jgi:hypothetical protein
MLNKLKRTQMGILYTVLSTLFPVLLLSQCFLHKMVLCYIPPVSKFIVVLTSIPFCGS